MMKKEDFLKTRTKIMGMKLREIRTTQNLSQKELGEKVGLSADRIQKYENGVMAPRDDVLNQLAEGLGVNPLALSVPTISTPLSTMFAIFDLERVYGFKPTIIEDKIYLTTDDKTLENYLDAWFKKYSEYILDRSLACADLELVQALDDDYLNWRWQFPSQVIDEKEIKKNKIKKQIEELQNELKRLEE